MPPLDLLARLGPRVASMHLEDIDRSRGAGRRDEGGGDAIAFVRGHR